MVSKACKEKRAGLKNGRCVVGSYVSVVWIRELKGRVVCRLNSGVEVAGLGDSMERRRGNQCVDVDLGPVEEDAGPVGDIVKKV